MHYNEPGNRVSIDGRELDERKIEFKQCRKTALAEAVQIGKPFSVVTLEGTMQGNAGDYLMKGAKGELYPCAKNVFDASYEFI